jgi:hypothetical protein
VQINAANVKLQQRMTEKSKERMSSEQKKLSMKFSRGVAKDISALHIAKLDLRLRPMVHGRSQGT